MAPRHALALALLCLGVKAGPLSSATEPVLAERAAPRKLHGRFLHITDIHPDEFYKVHSSTDEDGACHRGKGPAGPYGAEASDCDSPFSLVNATFDWIDANLKDTIDFVIWTGDSARHDRDEGLPRNADQVLGTNTWIADRFADLFASKNGKGMTVPVVPTFGNNDILPHNILLPGPNKWLSQYSTIWRHFIPEEQRHSFEFGGWFHVEVIPNQLAVFSLNTLFFFDRNAGVDGCADPAEPGYKQMEWLKVQLQMLRERGMKAILMGHVPPARTESKMLWDETCWQKYSLWMDKFRDVVVVGLYGHMNIDHFLIHDNKDIDIAALGGSQIGTREAMGDELSIKSAADYLTELRANWAKLKPPPEAGNKAGTEGRKKKKGKKRKDVWGERYHLSLVGPSVVPTYFPTLRVLEYNITGLEDAPVWGDVAGGSAAHDESSQKHLDLRHLSTETDDEAEIDTDTDDLTSTKKRKKKHRKGGKKKPADDPNLLIPSPPSKSAPPGPAYSPQPLTLTGYTQYFANLTHINNLTLTTPAAAASQTSDPDPAGDSSSSSWWSLLLRGWEDAVLPQRWRNGKHGGKKPATPRPPQPREFAFVVEYSTFEDRLYKLGDLTVNSFVELAVKMGKRVGGKAVVAGSGEGEEWDGDDGDDDWDELEEGETDDDDEGSDEEGSGDDDEGEVEAEKKRKGRKGKKKRRKQNKVWLHFLRHAFIGTLEKDELKKFSE